MKKIAVDAARTIFLFPLVELNPNGMDMNPVIRGVVQRYNFKIFPKHTLDFAENEKGLIFEGGEFESKRHGRIIAKLKVFDDGLVADTYSSTDDSKDLLEDAMSWLKAEFGLSLPSDRERKILYLSELTVTTDNDMMGLNPNFARFAALLSKKLSDVGSSSVNDGFKLSTIGFWPPDPRKSGAPAPFRFEMKAGTVPSDKRYYSQAPLTTEAHLEVLNEFEKLFSYPQ